MNEQGTEAWKRERLGMVTASRIADVVARTKTGWAASRANYMAQLLAERLTGELTESYISAAMQWGIDHEAQASDAYAWYADVDPELVGFVLHPSIPMTGASPDRMVGEYGLAEIKCPNTATHIDALLGAAVDGAYIKQMMWQMACTQRRWCDFVSFDPRLPEPMRLHVVRIARDDAQIAELEAQVKDFLHELAEREAALRSRYVAPAPIAVQPAIEQPDDQADAVRALLADTNAAGMPRFLLRNKADADTPRT